MHSDADLCMFNLYMYPQCIHSYVYRNQPMRVYLSECLRWCLHLPGASPSPPRASPRPQVVQKVSDNWPHAGIMPIIASSQKLFRHSSTIFFFFCIKHRGLGEEKKKEKEENVKKWTWSDLNRKKNVSHFRKGTEHDVVIAPVNKCIWGTLKAIRSYSCTCVWESQMIILFQWAWDVNVSVIRYWKSF